MDNTFSAPHNHKPRQAVFQNRPPAHNLPRPPSFIDLHDGVLLTNKPSGPTSHDVVDIIRRQFKFNKVGHGGTLDPQATGLLIILIGKGTKFSNVFIGSDKVYEGIMRLGVSTDTQDAQGKILRETDCHHVTKEQVEEQMKKYTGDIFQTPPMISAVKVNGVPLYKSARKGKIIEREPKLIHIYEFKLLDFKLPDVFFSLRCTKGTYVRTICADIGDALGCGAHLAQLCRIQCGNFNVKNALPLQEILGMKIDELVPKIIPLNKLPAHNC